MTAQRDRLQAELRPFWGWADIGVKVTVSPATLQTLKSLAPETRARIVARAEKDIVAKIRTDLQASLA